MQMKRAHFTDKYGPWAIVTGASSGLGAEFAEQLAQKRMNLVLVARRAERLRAIAERLEHEYLISTKIIAVDLAQPESIDRIIEAAISLEVGLLVNNAGYSRTGALAESSIQDEMLMLRVNCEAPFQLGMWFVKQMAVRGKGGVIFVSSSVGFTPTPNWTHYAATKAYTRFLAEGLFHELRGRGVDVLALCPGGMKTEFQNVAGITDMGAMPVKPVVASALRSLGHKAADVPGWHIRLLFCHLPKFLPRRLALGFYGLLIAKLRKDGGAAA